MATQVEIQARLDNINSAIDAVLTAGQSYALNGKTFTRADLPTLERMRKDAERELSIAKGGSRRTAAHLRSR